MEEACYVQSAKEAKPEKAKKEIKKGNFHHLKPDWLHVTVALYVATGVKMWKKMEKRGGSHLPPPRWHRWICAGQTAAPPDRSGCNSSSTVASGHHLPEQSSSCKKTWSDVSLFTLTAPLTMTPPSHWTPWWIHVMAVFVPWKDLPLKRYNTQMIPWVALFCCYWNFVWGKNC